MTYKINKSIHQRTYKVALSYGKLIAVLKGSHWESKLLELLNFASAVSAVTINKNIFERLNLQRDIPKRAVLIASLGDAEYQDYKNYRKVEKETINNANQSLSIERLLKIHAQLQPKSATAGVFRKGGRTITKLITENGVAKEIKIEVLTKPAEIMPQLTEFITWYNSAKDHENPLVLAAIAHLEISRIHPFEDANGRVARIVEHIALGASKELNPELLPTENYFLKQSELYYSLIEKLGRSQDITTWIEFFSEAVLNALQDSIRQLKVLTGGAIDVENGNVINLSEIETSLLEIFLNDDSASPASIARDLGYSRQNIYRVIRLLTQKGLLQKSGTKYQSY